MMRFFLEHKVLVVGMIVALACALWWLSAVQLAGGVRQVSEINALRLELDMVPISLNSNAFWPWEVWQAHAQVALAVGEKQELEHKKKQIVQEFDTKANAYFAEVAKHVKAEVFQSTDLGSVSFADKKDLDKFLNARKKELRVFLLKENSDGKVDYRWQTDPQEAIKTLPLRYKVGQLFSVGITGISLSAANKSLLEKYRPGGVVFLGSNVSSESQLKSFTKEIQNTNPEHVMFIMTDQEGGVVKRIWWDQTQSTRALADLDVKKQCDQLSSRAKTLWRSGINFNLGTVVDVTNDTASFIYSRVYSGDFAAVAKFVETSQECADKVVTTLKHYPGHGATTADTHKQLATVGLSLSDWDKTHLMPFKKAGGETAIMVSHIILTALDAQQPASLSKKHVDYLREQVGFEGLLITDDMLMLDASGIDRKQAALSAVKAGHNILLYAADLNQVGTIIDFIITEIKADRLSESKIDSSLEVILQRKNVLTAELTGAIPQELIY